MVELSLPQKKALDSLRREPGIRLIVAFGSQVRGDSHAGSDLDIGVLLERAEDLRLDLLSRISEIFPEHQVDVALLNRADPLLLGEIAAHSVLLAGTVEDLQELRIYAFKRFTDYRRFFKLEATTNERHLESLRNGA